MLRAFWIVLGTQLLGASFAAGQQKLVDLASEGVKVGAVPDGCRSAKTGSMGGEVRWQVRKTSEMVLGGTIAEVSQEKTDTKYPLCILDALRATDIDVSVDITPIAGDLDRAGGIAVRLIDPLNYYLVRANALEQNVRLYHVVNGIRTQFAGVEAHVFSGMTQRLRLVVKGDEFSVMFAGKKLFNVKDKRFQKEGAVALWTKADSLTEFSNVTVEILQ